MSKMLKVILPIILTVGLLIAGCSSQAPDGDMLAPDFQLKDLDGQIVSLSDFRGEVVLLNFWATWCAPCVFEMPYLQEIYEEWSSQGLVVLTINVGDSPSEVEEFMQNHNLSLPVLLDINREVASKYNLPGYPTTFLVDKDGIIQAAKVGAFSSKEEIEAGLTIVIP